MIITTCILCNREIEIKKNNAIYYEKCDYCNYLLTYNKKEE